MIPAIDERTPVSAVRAMIRSTAIKRVFVQPRFGCSEAYLRVAKVEALWLLKGYAPATKAHEAELIVWGDVLNDDELYLG